MPLYDNTGRLAYDGCSVAQRDATNRAATSYTFDVLRPRPPGDGDGSGSGRGCAPGASPGAATTAALQHPSLRAWDGYGWNAQAVDCDTHARLSGCAMTSDRAKAQLPTRVFQAAPDLSTPAPDDDAAALESALKSGVDTSRTRHCVRLGELDYARFVPGVCPVGVQHIVPVAWTAGGASSRDIARSARFRRIAGSGRLQVPDGGAGADGGGADTWERALRAADGLRR